MTVPRDKYALTRESWDQAQSVSSLESVEEHLKKLWSYEFPSWEAQCGYKNPLPSPSSGCYIPPPIGFAAPTTLITLEQLEAVASETQAQGYGYLAKYFYEQHGIGKWQCEQGKLCLPLRWNMEVWSLILHLETEIKEKGSFFRCLFNIDFLLLIIFNKNYVGTVALQCMAVECKVHANGNTASMFTKRYGNEDASHHTPKVHD